MKESTLLVAFVLTITQLCEAGRILVILPVPSHSHHVAFRPLWDALSLRGHEVVLITTDPTNDVTRTNLTEINFKHNYGTFKNLDWVKFRLDSMSWNDLMQKRMWPVADRLVHNIYKHPDVQKMYAPNSGVKFDVVLAEAIFTPGIYALAYRFNAPLIGITSLGLTTFQHFIIGNPVLPSHRSSWDLYQRDIDLSFTKRLGKFVTAYRLIYNWYHDFIPRQQRIAEFYLGNDLPLISDLESNMSAIFTSQQTAISFPRPNVPNVISYATMHVKKTITPLPKDLRKFVDEAHQGFIYVSFGTNVKTTQMTNEMLQIFIEVFSQLPCRVLWKYDGVFKQKHENIFTAKWFPQQSVLAHPKVRIYFYQGGLQSTEEALHFAVPLIGMPVVADQDHQITKLVGLGIARRVDIENISKEALLEPIYDILNDKRYKERMLAVHEIDKKRPYDSSKNLIWWIEFIMSRRGAPHLRCNIADEPWYQKYDTDVIAFISIILFLSFISVVMVLYSIILYLLRYYIYVKLFKSRTKEKTN